MKGADAAELVALAALWGGSFLFMRWPAVAPSAGAWGALALLAFACAGIAYLMYFRLIAHVGPANAIAVTFLVPAFAVLWGWVVLGETLTVTMLLGCAVIVLGPALATGVLGPRHTVPAR